jgi:hypothetical protein
VRREIGRRLEALERRRKPVADDAMDWSMLDVEELRALRAWITACGDRDWREWARTLDRDERWRLRGVIAKLAGQPHAA